MYRYGAVTVSLLVVSIVAVFSCMGGAEVAQAQPAGEAFVLAEEIRGYWDEGYRITDVAYGDGMWAVVMTEGTEYGRQAWVYSLDFPDDFITEKWDEGLDLTTLAYGDGAWVAVMTGGLDWQQSLMRGSFEEVVDHMDKYPDFMIERGRVRQRGVGRRHEVWGSSTMPNIGISHQNGRLTASWRNGTRGTALRTSRMAKSNGLSS